MNGEQKKILVVDDDASNLTIMYGILSSQYKVYPINSGADALEFLQMHRPDLILLDVEMPDMDGKSLLLIIKSKPEYKDIPVVFLTGNSDIESEAEAFKMGVSDYIRKPINSIVLLARVKMQMELVSRR